MVSNKENIEHNSVKLLILSLLAFAFVLASSVGVFDKVYSITKGVQAGYRAEINVQAEKIIDLTQTISDIAAVKEDRDNLQKETIRLREEMAILKQQLQENELKNGQVKSIPGSFQSGYTFLPAYVVGYKQEDPGIMEINKGTKDGLAQGDIVTYHQYVIGEITTVYDYTSEIKTILAPENKITVVSEKGVKGILRARNGRELYIEQILIDSKLEKGDDFFTSGKNSNFPEGLYIGEVKSIEVQASNTTKTAKIGNEIDFNSLNEVFILKHEN